MLLFICPTDGTNYDIVVCLTSVGTFNSVIDIFYKPNIKQNELHSN